MAKKKVQTSSKRQAALPQLPKNALARISLGDSFAEYDQVLQKESVFVRTNAFDAARDPAKNKCFFIGRRGTGKTATTIELHRSSPHVLQIHPEVFGPLNVHMDLEDFAENRQKPFKTLVAAFELTMQFELVYYLIERGKISREDLPDFARKDLSVEDNRDFDLRAVRFVQRSLDYLAKSQDRKWIKEIKRPKQLAQAINDFCKGPSDAYTIIIDRIDDSWDGSELNVRLLASLMHACGEITTRVSVARALLFLRENVFERVRITDSEFSRIETRVVGMSWTEEKLLEFVERRLNEPFNSKWPLGGKTWGVFFEKPEESRRIVFDFCQNRPRDVLTYVKFAIENATDKNHDIVLVEDLLHARKRFSDSRLKDLGDEYDENYPRIQTLLEKFYGLGWKYTRRGMESLLQKLLVDKDVGKYCKSWFYSIATTEAFVNLFYQIGFLGILDSKGGIRYRSIGPQTTSTPAITGASDFEIHPMYRDALDLQNVVVDEAVQDLHLGTTGALEELPNGLNLDDYTERLNELENELKTLPWGSDGAQKFERTVADIVRLCLFRSLGNVEEKTRTSEGHVIRDIVVSNRASGGFWGMIGVKYGASQIVWECKNYEVLESSDFHQATYYLNESFGRFGILVSRGEMKPSYYPHIRKIANDDRMILPLFEKDLLVFIRQARAGKVKDSHVQDKYDTVIRKIS